MNTSRCSVTPCRTLAKSLLKHNRQDVLLCGVYAQREAVFGNIDHARKIFDKALSSIDGLPQDRQMHLSYISGTPRWRLQTVFMVVQDRLNHFNVLCIFYLAWGVVQNIVHINVNPQACNS